MIIHITNIMYTCNNIHIMSENIKLSNIKANFDTSEFQVKKLNLNV